MGYGKFFYPLLYNLFTHIVTDIVVYQQFDDELLQVIWSNNVVSAVDILDFVNADDCFCCS